MTVVNRILLAIKFIPYKALETLSVIFYLLEFLSRLRLRNFAINSKAIFLRLIQSNCVYVSCQPSEIDVF